MKMIKSVSETRDNSLSNSDSSCESEEERALGLLKRYLLECSIKSYAHSLASEENRVYSKRASWLSGLFPAFAGVLSVGAFSDLDSCGNLTNEMLIGMTVGLSFLSTICTLTKTVFRYSEKDIEHHNSSGHFGDIAADIELFLAKRAHGNGSLKSFLDTIHELVLVRESTSLPLHRRYIDLATSIYKPTKSGCSSAVQKIEILKTTV